MWIIALLCTIHMQTSATSGWFSSWNNIYFIWSEQKSWHTRKTKSNFSFWEYTQKKTHPKFRFRIVLFGLGLRIHARSWNKSKSRVKSRVNKINWCGKKSVKVKIWKIWSAGAGGDIYPPAINLVVFSIEIRVKWHLNCLNGCSVQK